MCFTLCCDERGGGLVLEEALGGSCASSLTPRSTRYTRTPTRHKVAVITHIARLRPIRKPQGSVSVSQTFFNHRVDDPSCCCHGGA